MSVHRAIPGLGRQTLAQSAPRAAVHGVPPERPWDLLLLCVAGYLATSIGRLHQLFPALLPLKPVLLSAALAIVLYMADQTSPRRIAWVRAPTTTYVLVLLLWMALSVPGALHQGIAFGMVTDNFVKTVVLYVLIAGCVRGFRDVERLAFVYFAAVVTFALVVITRFHIDGDNWRLAGLYFYDANDFATLAVTAMPLGFYLVVSPGKLRRRVIGALGLLPLIVAFIWSGSRGGFLALLAMLAFLLFRYTAVRVQWRALSTAIVVTMLATTASDKYWTQMTTILHTEEDYNRTADVGREKIWRRGITYMLANPVFGVGGGNFGVAEGTISSLASRQEYGIGVRWNAAHNSFVQVGAELGIPGLLLLLAVIGSAFRVLHRVGRLQAASQVKQRGPPQLAQALASSLVGFVVGAFFLSLAYSEMLYALAALTVALAKVISLADGTTLGTASAAPRYLRSTTDPRR
jgi:O-antigen ligase